MFELRRFISFHASPAPIRRAGSAFRPILSDFLSHVEADPFDRHYKHRHPSRAQTRALCCLIYTICRKSAKGPHTHGLPAKSRAAIPRHKFQLECLRPVRPFDPKFAQCRNRRSRLGYCLLARGGLEHPLTGRPVTCSVLPRLSSLAVNEKPAISHSFSRLFETWSPSQ